MRPSHWLKWGGLKITGRAPRIGVVFHHIPKCAGTAVRLAIKRCYRPDLTVDINSVPSVRAVSRLESTAEDAGSFEQLGVVSPRTIMLRTEMLYYHLSAKALCGGGHIPFNCKVYEDFHGTHQFITVLRDPVDRFISQYFWSKHRGVHDRIRATLDERFIETTGQSWGSMMVAYTSGLPWTADHRSREAIEAAKSNLAKFAVVGFLDDMARFSLDLKERLGISVRIPKINRSPAAAGERERLTPELRESIRRICGPDLELFAHAREMGQRD